MVAAALAAVLSPEGLNSCFLLVSVGPISMSWLTAIVMIKPDVTSNRVVSVTWSTRHRFHIGGNDKRFSDGVINLKGSMATPSFCR